MPGRAGVRHRRHSRRVERLRSFAGRQPHLLRNDGFGFLDEADQVASIHVGLDQRIARALLASDLGRSAAGYDPGDAR